MTELRQKKQRGKRRQEKMVGDDEKVNKDPTLLTKTYWKKKKMHITINNESVQKAYGT